MQVDFLLPKRQGFTTGSKGNRLHAQNSFIEFTGFRDVGNGQYQVIKAVNFHLNKEEQIAAKETQRTHRKETADEHGCTRIKMIRRKKQRSQKPESRSQEA
jgi:hypothetical protein